MHSEYEDRFLITIYYIKKKKNECMLMSKIFNGMKREKERETHTHTRAQPHAYTRTHVVQS